MIVYCNAIYWQKFLIFSLMVFTLLLFRLEKVPAVTSLSYQGGLTLGVGTLTGQILLYDIRSSKPFLVKDHMYGLPIKNIEFHRTMDMVYSMDSSIVKIWEKNNVSKIYESVDEKRE